jgi:predicted phosphodiesterase
MVSIGVDFLILGHTHKPFIHERTLDSGKKLVIINPGSVGQPRDDDPRASYAVLDVANMDAKIIRVEYDIDSVVERINKFGLPNQLGERLYRGI